MKRIIALLIALMIFFSSYCAYALDVDKAYNDFKEAHPDFVSSLINGGISEEVIVSFIHDVYDYLLEIDSYTPVTADNFEENAIRAITDVSAREAYYSLQDTLLILYPSAIRLAVSEGKVADEFKPLVETIKSILFSEEDKNISSGNGDSQNASAPEAPKELFSDLSVSHWAFTAVNCLAENFILNGYLDGSFKPENKITRAEFAKIIVSALSSYKPDLKSDFSDVPADSWYYTYVSSAYSLGLITGYPDGSFRPNDNITRADICTIVNRALKFLPDGSVSAFTDDSGIPTYARDSVYALAAKGIISGNPDKSFKPTDFATRAQTAKIIYSAFFN